MIKSKHNYKYDPDICNELPEMFANGESIVEVAQALGISKRCFYDWQEKHTEFKEAVEAGLSLSEAWWLKLGRAGAMGKVQVNSAVWIFNMKNRHKWTDRQAHTGGDGGAIETKGSIVFNPVGADYEPNHD